MSGDPVHLFLVIWKTITLLVPGPSLSHSDSTTREKEPQGCAAGHRVNGCLSRVVFHSNKNSLVLSQEAVLITFMGLEKCEGHLEVLVRATFEVLPCICTSHALQLIVSLIEIFDSQRQELSSRHLVVTADPKCSNHRRVLIVSNYYCSLKFFWKLELQPTRMKEEAVLQLVANKVSL